MYQNGKTLVIGNEQEFIEFIKVQFANGAKLLIQTPDGEIKTIKIRKL